MLCNLSKQLNEIWCRVLSVEICGLFRAEYAGKPSQRLSIFSVIDIYVITIYLLKLLVDIKFKSCVKAFFTVNGARNKNYPFRQRLQYLKRPSGYVIRQFKGPLRESRSLYFYGGLRAACRLGGVRVLK